MTPSLSLIPASTVAEAVPHPRPPRDDRFVGNALGLGRRLQAVMVKVACCGGALPLQRASTSIPCVRPSGRVHHRNRSLAMTRADDVNTTTRHHGDDDRVVVSPGVPTDRVRWGPILAGTFAALTALAVLSTLGTAIGLSAYDPGQDDPRNFARAGGVWGVLSLILAFAFGGWLTARAAAVRGRSNGMLNGFMVAGFGIPLMLFMLGSLASSVGQSAAQVADDAQQARTSQSDSAMTASATIGGGGN